MGRRRKNRIQAFVLLIGLVLLLSGCTKFDACAYMQAILDVSYKNETEGYMEITGVTQEEADEIFKNNLDATMHEFSSTELPEELEANYRLLFEDTVKQVKYTVGEAVEGENKNYTVEVAVEPILLFDETYEEFQNKTEEYASEISNNVMSGGELPSDDEIQNQVYQTYYEVLKTALNDGLTYGEVENITVHMNRMEDGAYEIPEEDLRALDQAMISQEKLEAIVGAGN